jgi:hypothetical protein
VAAYNAPNKCIATDASFSADTTILQPPYSNVSSRSVRNHRRNWNAKIRGMPSCLLILTVKSFNDRPVDSHRTVKSGAKSRTAEDPSTRWLTRPENQRIALHFTPTAAPG